MAVKRSPWYWNPDALDRIIAILLMMLVFAFCFRGLEWVTTALPLPSLF